MPINVALVFLQLTFRVNPDKIQHIILVFLSTTVTFFAPMLHSIPPECVRKSELFWRFQGALKWIIGKKWVKYIFPCWITGPYIYMLLHVGLVFIAIDNSIFLQNITSQINYSYTLVNQNHYSHFSIFMYVNIIN